MSEEVQAAGIIGLNLDELYMLRSLTFLNQTHVPFIAMFLMLLIRLFSV